MTDNNTPEQGHRDDEAAGRVAAEQGRVESAQGRDDAQTGRNADRQEREDARHGREDAKVAADDLSEQVRDLTNRTDLTEKVTALSEGVVELAHTVSTLATTVSTEKTWRKRATYAGIIFAIVFALFSCLNLFILNEVREISAFNQDCNTVGSDCFDVRTSTFVETVEEKVGRDINKAAEHLVNGIEIAMCRDANDDGIIGPAPGVSCVVPPPLIIEVPATPNPSRTVGGQTGGAPAPAARTLAPSPNTTTPGASDGHSQACTHRPQSC